MNTLKIGNSVPDFSACDQDGNLLTLSDFMGKKWIVFFYPKADTPGCTAEACNLRDYYTALLEKGYSLIGVSADSVKRQKKFKDKYKLPFPLLADVDKSVIQAFGVWGPKFFMGKWFEGVHRITFLVNEQGIITQVIDKVKTNSHASQILEIND